MNTATAPRQAQRAPAQPAQQVATTSSGAVAERAPSFGEELKAREGQFKAALPAHIPLERFMRVVMTAIQRNTDLAQADRASLFTSAMQAAQDGLLPDGREGALVIYNSKVKEGGREIWIKMVQWMPMIAGIRKKVRNSGEIVTWNAHVVYEHDAFDYELGDEPYIKHKPLLNGDRGQVIAAYSIAVLKKGEKSFEVMSRAQIDKVRSVSKSKDGPAWSQWYDEMCRKAVARRHSKVLPMSTDLDDLIRRDDELYDLKGAREEAVAANGGRPQSLAGRLDVLAQMPGREHAPEVQHDPKTGEVMPSQSAARRASADGDGAGADSEDGAADQQNEADEAGNDHQQAMENEQTPREDLLEKLRDQVMDGTGALRVLNGLTAEQAALLTAKDKDDLKAFARANSRREAVDG